MQLRRVRRGVDTLQLREDFLQGHASACCSAKTIAGLDRMARKKIREHDAKRLLKQHFQRLAGVQLPIQCVQVTSATDLNDLLQANPWLNEKSLVVKPDMLFGQVGRGGTSARV